MPPEDMSKLQHQQQQQPGALGLPPERDGRSLETRLVMMDYEIVALRREIAELRENLDELNDEKEKLMRWGLMALGMAVLGMGTWIFNFVFSHIKT